MLNTRYLNARFLVALCALTLAALLGTSASARAATSVLSASPATWDFGSDDIHSGGGPSQTFTFTNDTADTVTVSGDTIVGPAAADFNLSSDTCPGAILAQNDFCTVQVRFDASNTGPTTSMLEITDDSGVLDVPLSGTGITGTLTASPSPLDFSPQPYFNGGQQQGINIQNSNDAGTQASSATITGPDATRFYIAWGDNCTNQQYGPGSSCGMGVGFNPPSGPGSFHAQLEISSDSLSSPLVIPLNATALSGPHMVISPSQADFGDIAVGTSATRTMTVSNDGDSPLQIQQAFAVSGTASVFPITADSCSGQIINPGSSCELTMHFQPNAAGYRDGTLLLITNSPGPVTSIGFTGTGVPSPSGAATITGTPAAGSTLTCNPVGYPAGTGYAYQWLRDGQAIAGATAATDVLTDGDVGSQLACQVTATNSVGAQTVTSPATGPVTPMDLSRLPGSFVDAGTCRTVKTVRELRAGGSLVTISAPQPAVPWAPLTLASARSLSASIDGQAAGSGRRVRLSPRSLAAYPDGVHMLHVATNGSSAQAQLVFAPCSLAVRVDGGPNRSSLLSVASRTAIDSATISLPHGLHLNLEARRLGRFTYRVAGSPLRSFDVVGARTASNDVTVRVSRHTIRVTNLPARTGVIRFTTRAGVLAGTGGTARASATLAGAPGRQTSSAPAAWLR